jgi:hypothetical protein
MISERKIEKDTEGSCSNFRYYTSSYLKETRKITKTSEWAVFGPTFEAGTSWVRSRSVNNSTTMFCFSVLEQDTVIYCFMYQYTYKYIFINSFFLRVILNFVAVWFVTHRKKLPHFRQLDCLNLYLGNELTELTCAVRNCTGAFDEYFVIRSYIFLQYVPRKCKC